MKLERKSVLLTGAGSGIGRQTAIQLARKAARLTLVGRRLELLNETVDLVRQEGGEAQSVAGDITVRESRGRALEAAMSRFGGLDILINNAGNIRGGRLELTGENEISAMIEVNLLAPILLTREALPLLRQSGDAALVNVSSGFGLVGAPFYATYCSVKAGIAMFGEALRRELSGEGIHVLTLYPAATDTPMMSTSRIGDLLAYESAEACAAALILGLESNHSNVIRGGESRISLIKENRDNPMKIDKHYRNIKTKLEEAVSRHRSI